MRPGHIIGTHHALHSLVRGNDGQDLSQQLEQLAVGCAYVSVPDHVRARKVYMSPD